MSSSQNEYSFFLRKPKILFAPLDWGLGHATRSIPLIQHLVDRGCAVTLAGDGAVAKLLHEAFPALPLLTLPGYHVRYAREARYFGWKMLQQLPRLVRVMQAEQRWLQEQVAVHGFDAVVSDNRPGLYHASLPTVYITHQVRVLAGSGWNTYWATRWHQRIIRRFGVCWVPDLAESAGLAGMLSHPRHLPAGISLQYLGPISRLVPAAFVQRDPNHLLILLSGPEPQRTLLEQALVQQLRNWPGTALVVRGLPSGDTSATYLELPFPDRMQVKQYLHSNDLALAMQQAGWVWCRSGYTTVMDLIRLNTRAVLVPTPGQSEQTYLAQHLSEAGWFPFQLQDQVNIDQAIAQLQRNASPVPTIDFNRYKQVIDAWLIQHFSPDHQ